MKFFQIISIFIISLIYEIMTAYYVLLLTMYSDRFYYIEPVILIMLTLIVYNLPKIACIVLSSKLVASVNLNYLKIILIQSIKSISVSILHFTYRGVYMQHRFRNWKFVGIKIAPFVRSSSSQANSYFVPIFQHRFAVDSLQHCNSWQLLSDNLSIWNSTANKSSRPSQCDDLQDTKLENFNRSNLFY
jgi:hypothetical protein